MHLIVKKLLILPAIVFCIFPPVSAKPILSKSQYLIATLEDPTGTVSPATGTYQLIYNPNNNSETAVASDYWIISNINGNQYTFQNASTKKYIKHDITATNDRAALTLVDAPQSDNSTSFSLELKQTNGVNYYIVRSVVNTTKIWDRRVSLTNSIYPVGVYTGTGSNNELFVFYDSSGNSILDDGSVAIALPTANRTLGAFNSYFTNFTINGKIPVADTSKKEFYISLPESAMGFTQNMTVNYIPVNSAYKLFINNTQVDAGSNFNFATISAKSTYSLQIKNNSTVIASANLYFSCLPIVQLYDDATIGNVYTLGRMAVTEPDKPEVAEVKLAKIKIRGAWSTTYNKKNFAVNLRDSTGVNSDDRSYFNLRNDNNWILDAMYIDPARMRNRVNTDMWNSFATLPYWHINEPKMRNGTRGHFVELFINDAYQGLYCMTERMDRKQLNLKKLKVVTDSVTKLTTYTQRGTTIKGIGWSNAVLMGYPYGGSSVYSSFNNNSLSWSQYECKYPEYDEGEPIMWDNLYAALQIPNSYYTNDANFRTSVADKFDMPVYLDYYLFIDLMLATDNHGKNTFTSIYDQTVSTKVSISPWDMDATWGIRWDGTKALPTPAQDLDNFLINNEHGQVNLFLRLKNLDVNGWKSVLLKERYRTLRAGAFSHDSIMARFNTYAALFALSGADTREIAQWGSYGLVTNISSEISFISDWVTKRLAYLDNQYLGAPYTLIRQMNSNILCGPNPVTDRLMISGLEEGNIVSIYSLQGVLMAKFKADGQTLHVDMSNYQPGVYFVKSGSYTAKIIRK
jgi:hypothetical protein